MKQSKLKNELDAPLEPEPSPSRRPERLPQQPQTQLPSSRVAGIALALAGTTVLASLAAITGWLLGLLSEFEMVFLLAFCLGASVISGTLAGIGWMHSKRRRDGRFDPVGVRRSLIAGALAGATLIGITIAINQIGSHQAVQADIHSAVPTQSGGDDS